jgi:TPR repeat protein
MHLGLRHSPTYPEQALICYTKAAQLEYAPSQVMLGWLALRNKDYVQALRWFEKGMSQGYWCCGHRLKQLFKEGEEPVKKMIGRLAYNLFNNQEVFPNIKEWAHEVLKADISQPMIHVTQFGTIKPIGQSTNQKQVDEEVKVEQEEEAEK